MTRITDSALQKVYKHMREQDRNGAPRYLGVVYLTDMDGEPNPEAAAKIASLEATARPQDYIVVVEFTDTPREQEA